MGKRLPIVFFFWFLFVHSATVQAVEQTRIFQHGVGGYTGGKDTTISRLGWDTPPQYSVNYGQNTTLELSRDGGDNPIIGFDLSGVPANSKVISAELSLYNTTQSSFSGTRDFARRIDLFQVLRDWDEGNQINSPIDTGGKHGATGDHAFDWYPGEGTDIAWAARGMSAETDYVSSAESYADVINPGWYSWNVSGLVTEWVRGGLANYGIVLRDATGYQDDHHDERTFVSNQGVDTTLRPRLTVVYNPDTPMADAGPDQEILNWNGQALTLDGSASHDRPGGNDAGLVYSWKVLRPAYGSTLIGKIISSNKIASFTPNLPGEWDIELTVTNSIGETATDTVHLRVLRLAAAHPRIYLTAARLTALKSRAVSTNFRWTQLKTEADSDDGEMHAKALVYQVTGQAAYGQRAITQALAMIADTDDWSTKAGDIALVYDWCYGLLTAGQKQTFIDYFKSWANDVPKSEDTPGWGNYWPRYGYSYALIGLAAYGDVSDALKWIEEYRYRRYRDNDLTLLNYIANGGGWPEGIVYDGIANWPRVKAMDAWMTATGENLFESSDWFKNRLGFILLHRWPGLADKQSWEKDFHPYQSTGDAERNRASMVNYERILSLILLQQFPNQALAGQLQAYLAAAPANNSSSFLYHEEFLWFNPDGVSQSPGLLTHYSPATGTVFMRSAWPNGAADTGKGAAYLTFQCGDHYTYHQHFDQNSFTLYKYGDLAVDSGVYSGEGLSWHDVNYYVRTLAHNTLVVHNADENLTAARPDAVSNDGGQRTCYPASRSPQTVDYFTQHLVHYDTGDIPRFEDARRHTYVFGDAVNAYNNPAYNQAMDTGYSGNTAKVSRFHREFVYLRPEGTAEDSDYLVLFDRVAVTRTAFSGSKTKLLFHVLNEPTVNGTASTVSSGETLYTGANLATAVSGEGKLFIKPLLPANIRKVGGRGVKAFWVFGDNYDWHWSATESQPRPINDFENIPYGEWRLEIEPVDTNLEHNFLTVLYPASVNVTAMPAATLISSSGMTGSHIADPTLKRVVMFSSSPAGTSPAGTLTYSYPDLSRTYNLLCDLTPGSRYQVTATQSGTQRTVTLTPDTAGKYQVGSQGTLSFMIPEEDEPVLSVSPAGRSVAKESGTASFSVSNTGTGSMPWTASVTAGGSWLSISSGAAGTNTGNITCAFTANNGASARTATIRVTASNASGSPKDVTVVQAGATSQSAAQFLGVWTDGVWAWDKSTGKWTRMGSTADVLMIAAGKVDTDDVDDLIGVWLSGLYVKQSTTGQWIKLSTSLPTWIIAGDLNNDGRDDVIGSWKNDGVYYRDSASGKWEKIASPAKQLGTGNIGGIREDLAGVWNDGLWVRYSATAAWQKIDAAMPVWIAVGDMTGDNRADIVGSYSSGTWYRNSATQAWTRITTPAEQVAVGDIDGDGRDDLIGIWSDGVYVRYGATGLWQKITDAKPRWITTGRMVEILQSLDSQEAF